MSRLISQLGRSRAILSMIVVIGLVIGYLTYSNSEEPLSVEGPLVAREDLELFREFNLDFSVLEDERFKSLQIFGENPVDPGITGERKNPFAPL